MSATFKVGVFTKVPAIVGVGGVGGIADVEVILGFGHLEGNNGLEGVDDGDASSALVANIACRVNGLVIDVVCGGYVNIDLTEAESADAARGDFTGAFTGDLAIKSVSCGGELVGVLEASFVGSLHVADDLANRFANTTSDGCAPVQ